MTAAVPYQAYKSKRHSRTASVISESSTPKKSTTFRRLQPVRQPERPRSPTLITRQFDRSPTPPSINGDVSSTPNSSLPPPSISPSPIASPPVSTSSLPPTPPRSSVPYRPGFQPRGVYRPRTDEFSLARKVKLDATRIERTKLERRLEKLINLHFPIDSNEPKNLPLERRKSTFFDFDLANLKDIDPTDIWNGVVKSQALQGAKAHIRAAEQRIAPWQQDAAVSKCPLCNTSFHPLTNRKHHCRLCGQIICSLPIKHPHRPEPCSSLFIVDLKTRQIEQVSEGVDYGVKRRSSNVGSGQGNGKEKEGTLAEDEKFLKGVRVCKSCKPILSREQFYQQVSCTPPLIRLYEAFVNLEKEIDEALPQFQELLMTFDSDSAVNKEAVAARKQIIDDFAAYDAITKRIRKLPCPSGSSQDRVQLAIRTRADLFLQKNMFPLQALPKANKQLPSSDTTSPLVDPESELAHALQPLLEQEALLESFVGEAMTHRKFEDAKTLKANLKEIRTEIDRMLENGIESGNS